MFQNGPFALDSLSPLPKAGREHFVEGEAIPTSRQTMKLS